MPAEIRWQIELIKYVSSLHCTFASYAVFSHRANTCEQITRVSKSDVPGSKASETRRGVMPLTFPQSHPQNILQLTFLVCTFSKNLYCKFQSWGTWTGLYSYSQISLTSMRHALFGFTMIIGTSLLRQSIAHWKTHFPREWWIILWIHRRSRWPYYLLRCNYALSLSLCTRFWLTLHSRHYWRCTAFLNRYPNSSRLDIQISPGNADWALFTRMILFYQRSVQPAICDDAHCARNFLYFSISSVRMQEIISRKLEKEPCGWVSAGFVGQHNIFYTKGESSFQWLSHRKSIAAIGADMCPPFVVRKKESISFEKQKEF